MKSQNRMTANSFTWWKIGIVSSESVVQYNCNDPCLSVKPMSMIRPMNFRRSSSSTSFHGSIFDVEAEAGGLALKVLVSIVVGFNHYLPKNLAIENQEEVLKGTFNVHRTASRRRPLSTKESIQLWLSSSRSSNSCKPDRRIIIGITCRIWQAGLILRWRWGLSWIAYIS